MATHRTYAQTPAFTSITWEKAHVLFVLTIAIPILPHLLNRDRSLITSY
jgi:hypothetical protein